MLPITIETISTIHEFWFGLQTDDAAVANERSKLWWRKDEQVDAIITQRFSAWVSKAEKHELDHWLDTALGRLALILLTDQFPRHIYRNTSRAFAFDGLAVEWCRQGIQENVQQLLRPIERVFFYLPLEHSESRDDQNLSVSLFEELVINVEPVHRSIFEGFLDYAVRHRNVIERFGRFPHRNRALGRESTLEERAFLMQPGSSF